MATLGLGGGACHIGLATVIELECGYLRSRWGCMSYRASYCHRVGVWLP